MAKKIEKTEKVSKVNGSLLKQLSKLPKKSIRQFMLVMLNSGLKYQDTENIIKKNFPDSKYQHTHYYWYIGHFKKLGLLKKVSA